MRLPVRADWRRRVVDNGLVYLPTELPDGTSRDYWNEGVAYAFTPDEIRTIESAVAELHALHGAAAQHILDHDLTARLCHGRPVPEGEVLHPSHQPLRRDLHPAGAGLPVCHR